MSEKESTETESQIEELRCQLLNCKKQLTKAHQMTVVGQLFAGIVHEINTPIGSILSNNQVACRSLELLKQLLDKTRADNTPPPPKADEILDTLVSLASVDNIACERIIAVVRGLKTFASSEGPQYQKSNLNEILDNTLKLAHCEFRRRIKVETDYGDIPEVDCDPHKLGQVFLNLLVNAGQAIEGEGEVAIKTWRDGDSVLVSISDTGSGISPEHKLRIFSSGFTTKPAGVGTGLGLAISRDIVDGHGGVIDFESEVGSGTTFRIRIPITRTTRYAG